MLKIEINDRGGAVVVKAGGELSLIEVPVFEQAFKKYHEENLDVIALDLSDMPFLDSFGISRIIKISKIFIEKGTDFVLLDMNDKMQQVFRMGTLDKVFTIMRTGEFNQKYFSAMKTDGEG